MLGTRALFAAALVGAPFFAAGFGGGLASAQSVPAVPKRADLPSQHMRLVDDFDGDGKADVIWQDASNMVHLSKMNRTTVVGCRQLGVQTDSLMGSGDFNGDGKADIVWRNMTTGAVRISFLDGDRISHWINVGSSPIALDVKLEGIGDFYGHGRPNILWRNQTTGRTVLSYHNSTGNLSYWATVSEFINPANTTALKVGDINGDGRADVVWRNLGTGNVVISLMNGATPTWRQITSTPIAPSVKLESIGDFDGNGRADLLWRNTTTGRSVMSHHQLDGSVVSWPVVSNYINPASTDAQGVGDFNGDGKDDILWRNIGTGNTVISVMNGSLPSWEAASFSSCSSLPHTGMTASQCYLAGSSAFVTCIGAPIESLFDNTSNNLYRHQDGHRRMINAKSYSLVPRVTPIGFYSGCIKDNNTGLIWQQPSSITPTRYTNLGTGGALDTSGLVASVNASNLCGFNDWRLPTAHELLTLIDHGKTTNPRIDTAWVSADTSLGHGYQWSSEIGHPLIAASTTHAFAVSFNKFDDESGEGFAGATISMGRNVLAYAKLVRGGIARAAPRFSYSSVAYGSDAANNLVNDAWTGLQWRRCPHGTTWNGSACTGDPSFMTHEQALVYARQQTGWRLPNVTEIGSLYDRSTNISTGYYINRVAFPSIPAPSFWTTTPWVDDPGKAWLSDPYWGAATPTHRSAPARVLMLRDSP